MAIKFKAVAKGQPGISGGGTKKHYAASVHNKEDFTLEKLTKGVEKSSTVSGADIRAVLYASVEEVCDALSESNIVRFGDLGSFRVSLSSEGKDTPEQVTEASIKNARIVFTPSTKLKAMLASAKFKKA